MLLEIDTARLRAIFSLPHRNILRVRWITPFEDVARGGDVRNGSSFETEHSSPPWLCSVNGLAEGLRSYGGDELGGSLDPYGGRIWASCGSSGCDVVRPCAPDEEAIWCMAPEDSGMFADLAKCAERGPLSLRLFPSALVAVAGTYPFVEAAA